MSGRSWNPVAEHTSNGLVYCSFSFKTNDTSDPAVADFRGCGGETGADTAGSGVSNSGPAAVTSITRTGVGGYLATLSAGYRFVQAAIAKIDDAADDLDARIGTISNEGAGNTTAVTVAIQVRGLATVSGTATESTGRRISVFLVLKNSGSGS